MRKIIPLILIAWMLTSCQQKHSLEANIKNLGNDTIIVFHSTTAKPFEFFKDTIYSKNDRFYLNNMTGESKIFYFSPKKAELKKINGRVYKPISKLIIALLSSGDKIKINGTLKNLYIDYESKGSEFNKQLSLIRKENIQQLSEIVLLDLKLDTLKSNSGNEEKIKEILKKKSEISKDMWKPQFNYIKNNWDKDLSAYYILNQPLDTLGKYYQYFGFNMKNGIYKNTISSHIDRVERIRKSQENDSLIKMRKIAPDFTLEALNGKEFKLSSLKKNYIVLDFWGSWCMPCLKGFPKMKEYHKKYKNEVEFISIACNDTKESWKKAVKENKLDWLQLINNSDMDLDVSIKYSIKGYPTKIILDKNKKIVEIFVGESNEFYEKLDELLK